MVIKMNTKLTARQQLLLDIYRIIAAFFVIAGHSFSYYQISILKNQDIFPYIQNIGVIMFFLLSGFLTTYSLKRKNESNDYSFYLYTRHKTLRIIKEYFPGLVFIAIIDFVSININNNYSYFNAYNYKQFLGNLFMLQGTFVNHIPGLEFIPFGSGRPLWTLAIEWWFYLIYGFLFLTISNNKPLSLRGGLISSLLFIMPIDYFISGRGNGLGFVFGLGILAFYIYDLIETNLAKIIFPASCIIYIVYGFFYKEAYTIYSFFILWISFCSLMKIGKSCTKFKERDRNPIISYISQSTFMLYLIHYSIIDLIFNLTLSINNYIKFLSGIIISIVMALIMYYIFGKKNALRASFNPKHHDHTKSSPQ